MKKIMMVTQGASGGVGRHIANLTDGLDKSKYKVIIVFNKEFADASFTNWLEKRKDIDTESISSLSRELNFKNDLVSIYNMLKLIKKYKPDVVHVHSSKAGALGRISAKIANVPNILYTPHAYSFLSREFSSKKKKVFVLIERVLSRFCTTRTINVSSSEKKAALRNNLDKESKFRVIPNAVPAIQNYDIKAERKRLGIEEDDVFLVGNIARVAEQKNPELFVKVAELVQKKDPTILFYWVGYKEERLKGFNTENNIVNFVGEMTDTDRLVSGFNLLFCTSIFEGMSYSLLEAACAGVPILLSNVEGNNDFEELYTDAQLFELTDSAESIANKIVEYKDKKVNKSGGQLMYSYNEMVKNIESLYSN
ncbi:glycosyltransferase [Latilactobacillus sakei]|uniref:glycosyltransferase n=1 Tax=Latilactobacillus sakei TaxID=1599 RepID=UPI0015F767F0|nr:glycosyltransferase [Latilactobacillus sakei]QMU87139.1 glycosyltransferase [Latilactobacillus sakei]